MKPIPDCVPGILRTVLDTAKRVSDDPFIHRKVLVKVMGDLVADREMDTTPTELRTKSLLSAYKALGVKDPYEKEKARRNKAMLGLEESFRQFLDAAPDRLDAALKLVLAGYASEEYGRVLGRADIERAILENLEVAPARDEREELNRALARAGTVMYLLDTAGEIVLDKLLIEELAKKRSVTAVAASRPLQALATAEDAEAVGLTETAEVIDPGAPMLGLVPERASRDFRERFAAADLVIAKGEDHFEALGTPEREVFSLLKARCPHVAGRLDVEPGSGVLVRRGGAGAEVAGAGARTGAKGN